MFKIESMTNETLGSRILSVVDAFLLEYALLLIGLFCVFVVLFQVYYFYFRVDKHTDHVDILKRYIKLEMYKRYRK
jgi:hypothetical protein